MSPAEVAPRRASTGWCLLCSNGEGAYWKATQATSASATATARPLLRGRKRGVASADAARTSSPAQTAMKAARSAIWSTASHASAAASPESIAARRLRTDSASDANRGTPTASGSPMPLARSSECAEPRCPTTFAAAVTRTTAPSSLSEALRTRLLS
jgi:hypothetical protein